jgi:hypothetical protein
MTNNTQLPAEVVADIKLSAKAFARGMWPLETNHEARQREYVAAVHEAGATEYASKLDQAQQEIESLTNQLKNHSKVSDENMKLLRQENEKARTLLQKVVEKYSRLYEWNSGIFNEIKQFLDGKTA